MVESERSPDIWYLRLVKRHRGWRTAALIGCLLLAVGTVVLLYYSWFSLIPRLANWGFVPITWNAVLASLLIFFLAFLPVGLVMIPLQGIWFLVSLSAEELEEKDRQELDQAQVIQKQIEDKIVQEESPDMRSLVTLVGFSRTRLRHYYETALKQTRRSFLYSTIAMWAGFGVILMVVIQYFAPEDKKPPENLNYLLISGGVVIEVISALFLWVYRNSLVQLTYFYGRQIYLHSVMMSFRISESMEKPDNAKQKIVDHLLDKSWDVQRPAVSRGLSLAKLAKKGEV